MPEGLHRNVWARMHGPTWLVAILIYGGWLVATVAHAKLPLPILMILGGFLVAWHGSLQHETIHGHPAGPKWIRRALGAPPLSLWLPYDVYRDTHRQHHQTAHLTLPEHDPESPFWSREACARMPPWQRALCKMQRTALGRLTVGPVTTIAAFLRSELARLRGDRARRWIWLRHLAAVAVVLAWVLVVAEVPLWKYLVAFVYPGTALTLLRSLVEHRADAVHSRRTTVVEAGWLFRLLYLNNNFHVTHHRAPHLPWFELPARWNAERAEGSHVVHTKGYLSLVRKHAIKPISDIVIS